MKLIYTDTMPRSIARSTLGALPEGSDLIVAAPQGSAFGLHLVFAAWHGRTSFPSSHARIHIRPTRFHLLRSRLQHRHRPEETKLEEVIYFPISQSHYALEIQPAIHRHVRWPRKSRGCETTTHGENEIRSGSVHLEDRTSRANLPLAFEASRRASLEAERPLCPTHPYTSFPRRCKCDG